MPNDKIVAHTVRQEELRALNEILADTVRIHNSISQDTERSEESINEDISRLDNLLRTENEAFLYQDILRSTLANAANDLNIHIEGEGITVLNNVRAFINEYYGVERYPLHVEEESFGTKLLSAVSKIFALGCIYSITESTVHPSMSGKYGLGNNHDDHGDGGVF